MRFVPGSRVLLFYLACLVPILQNPPAARAQTRPWTVDVQVMVQPSPRDRINAQKWGTVLYKLGRRATFRQGRQGEKTRIEQVDEASGRTVRVVGLMNRDGSVSFGRETFRITEPQALDKWLKYLEVHGPKGPANESATWGLSEDQLTEVLRRLGQVVTDPVDERSVASVIESLQLRPDFQVSFTDSARRRIDSAAADPQLNSNYAGLTRGTVLAAALAQSGLGFRPKVSDRGGYLLEIDAGDESSNLFPVGWKSATPVTLLVPELSKRISIELEEAVPLTGLIELLADKLHRPVLYSSYDLAAAGISVKEIRYSRKFSRLTIFSLMSSIGRAHHLDIGVRVDEAGSAFLWVTSEPQHRAFQKRFAHVKPAP